MVLLFGQLNIAKMSTHSELALANFIYEQNIALLALQETGHWDISSSTSLFKNYQIFVNTNKPTENLSGVGLIIDKKLKPELVSELMSDKVDNAWCQITLNNKRVLVGSAYCKPNSSTENLVVTSTNITHALKYSKTHNFSSVIVYGDFNARNTDWGDTVTSNRGKMLAEYIDKENWLLCSPFENTFVCDGGGSVIDLILTQGRISLDIKEQWIEKDTELFSGAPRRGHYPILHGINHDQTAAKARNVSNWEKANWSEWQTYVESESKKLLADVGGACPSEVAKSIWNSFVNTVTVANSHYIPKKKISQHSKPYWNLDLTKLSLELQKARKTFRKRATPNNKFILSEATSKFKKKLIKDKNDWIRTKTENLNIKNSTEFWKRYRKVFGAEQNNHVSNLIDGNNLLTTNEAKENLLFKTYFTGQHLKAKGRLDNDHETIEEYERIKNSWDTTNKPTDSNENGLNDDINEGEIRLSIEKQNNDSKAEDPDGVHPCILKHLGENAIKVLKTIFNYCISTGSWLWQTSYVTFLRKPGKPSYNAAGAYRPISLSSYIGKILERIIDHRLRQHIDSIGKFDDEQEGFSKGRSTTRYLFRMLANLTEIKRQKLSSIILFLDFEKAFDSVYIPRLITKLSKFSINGNLLKLLNTFLVQRSVKLRVNGATGISRLVNLFGLPQGSVLSPFLFILYISDMFESTPNELRNLVNCYKFADDGSLVTFHKEPAECYKLMQKVCDYLGKWCKENKLVLNCDKNKTEAIILKSKNKNQPQFTFPKLKIEGNEIEYVKSTKVLGIIIDEDLSFKEHANDKLKQCNQSWGLLKKNTTRDRGLNVRSLTLLLKTIVLTKLLYGSMIWLHKNLKIFDAFWNKVILKCSGSMFYPHRELTEFALQLPPLDVQLELITVKFLCKCIKAEDLMTNIVHQIEGSLNNTPIHHQLNNFRDYLSWKLQIRSRRHIDLTSEEVKQASVYTKEEMELYTKVVWYKKAKNRCQTKSRTSKVDTQVIEATTNGYTNGLSPREYIFGHNTSRYADTRVFDFLHGSSTQFQNFCHSLKISTSSICTYCETEEDSPEHQLFHCYALDDSSRRELVANIDNPSTFLRDIVFTSTTHYTHKLLYERVDFITSINTEDL